MRDATGWCSSTVLQPEVSLETFELMPHMTLSRPEEIGQALRWVAILRSQLKISLAATGSVHEGTDVLKLLLVGANAVMIASALVLHGPSHLTKMLDEVRSWMDRKGLASISDLKLKADPSGTHDLASSSGTQYIKTIVSTVTNMVRIVRRRPTRVAARLALPGSRGDSRASRMG